MLSWLSSVMARERATVDASRVEPIGRPTTAGSLAASLGLGATRPFAVRIAPSLQLRPRHVRMKHVVGNGLLELLVGEQRHGISCRVVYRQQPLDMGRIKADVGPDLGELAEGRVAKGQGFNELPFLCGCQACIRLRTKATDVA